MTRKEEIRQAGFYWVKTLNEEWVVARLILRAFCFNGCSFPESDFLEIGPRLTAPESAPVEESQEELWRAFWNIKEHGTSKEKINAESKFILTRKEGRAEGDLEK